MQNEVLVQYMIMSGKSITRRDANTNYSAFDVFADCFIMERLLVSRLFALQVVSEMI